MADTLEGLLEELGAQAKKVNPKSKAQQQKLLALKDQIAELKLLAIKKALEKELKDYQTAMAGMNSAMTDLKEAENEQKAVEGAIKNLGKALAFTAKLLKAMA